MADRIPLDESKLKQAARVEMATQYLIDAGLKDQNIHYLLVNAVHAGKDPLDFARHYIKLSQIARATPEENRRPRKKT